MARLADPVDLGKMIAELALASIAHDDHNLKKNLKRANECGWHVASGLDAYELLTHCDIRAYLSQVLREQDFANVLDLGCGNGTFLHEIEEWCSKVRAYGITNYFLGAVHPRDHIIVGDVLQGKERFVLDELPADAFDLIVSANMLMYVQPEVFSALFSHIHRLLRPGRRAALEAFDGSGLPRLPYDQFLELARQYSVRELVSGCMLMEK